MKTREGRKKMRRKKETNNKCSECKTVTNMVDRVQTWIIILMWIIYKYTI